jgi:molecular chaperone HtpG
MHDFSADVSKVLRLVIHSIYTNKDIFLRELISNASDACEKARYLIETGECEGENELQSKIEIILNKKEKYISVKDNGIGMTENELINHLGTIAKSGTEDFLNKIENSKTTANELIGQFGVGFYSCFMVSDKVEVKTRRRGKNGEKSLLWTSNGVDGFEIKTLKEDIQYGTEVKVYIKEENQEDYLNQFKVENIIKTYSNHISFPISLQVDNETTQINSEKALWMRQKNEITEEQYENFFHSLCHMPSKPFMIMHNKVEGNLEFTNLLFIPSTKPFDLYHPDMLTRIKLYVRHVFISEKDIDIIPHYLRFVYGIVDSNDLPLNMSRETLQDNKILSKIRDNLVKKILSELETKAEKEPEQYNEFWKNFGPVLKEGLCESIVDRETLMKITRFYTSKSKDKLVSFDEYIAGMKENQKEIYFFTGENIDEMMSSPEMEVFIKNNIEVILFTDVVDSFWTSVIHDHKGKDLKSITRADIDLKDLNKQDDDKNKNKTDDSSKEEKTMIDNFMKILQGKVSAVKITTKLIDSPSCLSVAPGTMDSRMEDYLVAQKQLKKRSLKILEINPKHKLVQMANQLLKNNNNNCTNLKGEDLVFIINDLACIAQGERLDNSNLTVKRILNLIEKQI